jgi:hypothetical protein
MMNTDGDAGHTCDPDPDAADDAPGAMEGLSADIPGAAPGKMLTAQAVRALIEADARRKAARPQPLPPEHDGRGGEEPTRYGDWEKKGLAIDF